MQKKKQPELLPCPFCGGEAELATKQRMKKVYRQVRMVLPENAQLVKTIHVKDREIQVYVYTNYITTCKNKTCRGRGFGHSYVRPESAIKTWNKRA